MPIQPKSPKIPWHFILIFFLFAIGMGTAGYFYYGVQKQDIKIEKQNELLAIADLKASQITNWRKERMSDAEVILENPSAFHHFQDCLNTKEMSLRQGVLSWMESLCKRFDYNSIYLLDAKGRAQLSVAVGDEPVGSYIQTFAVEAIKTKKVILTDLYRDETTHHIHIDILIPLVPRDRIGSPVGVLLIRTEPQQFLYPLIQTWPTPSRTAESLLVRREGNEVVFLNELRHQKNTALSLRIPISEQQMPAVMGMRGVEGIVEGLDYRGVKVLAAVRAIPGSPWYLIAKIDQEEIYAPIREHAWFAIILVGTLILAAGVSAGFLWRHKTAQFYQKQYETELERQALIQHFDYLSKYANDIILLTDHELKIVEVNDRAVESYGYTRGELLQLNAQQLRSPEAPLLDEFVKQVDDRKRMVFETVHQRKDGTTFPVETSIRAIEVEGKKFYQSIIRDITERKKMEEMLKVSIRQWQTTFEGINDAICLLDVEGKILQCNKTMATLLGKPFSEIIGSICCKLVHGTSEPIEGCPRIRMRETRSRANLVLSMEDQWFNVSSDPILDETDHLIGTVHIISDITERKRAEEERERLICELQKTLSEIKTLKGIFPICASCKKIRDDKGYWNQVEVYIRDHSEAEFSHGICPECMKKLYPDFADEEK